MKNVIIFLAGALFGVGGIYIYHSQNGSVELNSAKSKVDTKSESITDESLNKQETSSDSELLEEIKFLKLQLAEKERKVVGAFMKPASNRVKEGRAENPVESEMSEEEYSKAMMDLFQKKNKPNAEEEKLGGIALEELKRNQPVELKELFSEKSDAENALSIDVENKYKKHLSQEKDNNWAYDAEGFLKNYFATLQDSNYTALRIDCRTRTCEVAGIFVFNESLENATQEEIFSSGRIQSFIKLQQEIQKNQFYNTYFEQGIRDLQFSPQALVLNPMPYSFFITRVK